MKFTFFDFITFRKNPGCYTYCPPPDHPHLYRRGDVKNLFYPSRILAEGSRGEGQCWIFAPETSCDMSKKKVKLILINSNAFINTPRCLVRCLAGESKRLRPRRTAKQSVEARRVALRENKSKSSPLQGWAMTPRGYCWGHKLQPSTEGPRAI